MILSALSSWTCTTGAKRLSTWWVSSRWIASTWTSTREGARVRKSVLLVSARVSDKLSNRHEWISRLQKAKLHPLLPSPPYAGLYVSYARINHSCLCNTKSVKFQDHRWVSEWVRESSGQGRLRIVNLKYISTHCRILRTFCNMQQCGPFGLSSNRCIIQLSRLYVNCYILVPGTTEQL